MNTRFAFSVLACTALALGCANSAEDAPAANSAAPSSALTVIEANPALGKLVASFRSQGRTVTFELRLGPKMETPPSAADPELPSYEIDAQVRDQDGKLFAQQMGGDQFIDPSWETRPRIAPVVAAERTLDFQISSEAAEAFRTLALPESLAQLRLGAIKLAESLEPTALNEKSDSISLPSDSPDGTLNNKGVLAHGPTTTAKWDYRIRKGPIAGTSYYHSAVKVRAWNSSTVVVFTEDSCNHSTCASQLPTTHCTMSGFRTDDGTNSRYFYSGGCLSPYKAASDPGYAHNCHDDSELQGAAVYFDRSVNLDAWGGSCFNDLFKLNPPGCF